MTRWWLCWSEKVEGRAVHDLAPSNMQSEIVLWWCSLRATPHIAHPWWKDLPPAAEMAMSVLVDAETALEAQKVVQRAWKNASWPFAFCVDCDDGWMPAKTGEVKKEEVVEKPAKKSKLETIFRECIKGARISLKQGDALGPVTLVIELPLGDGAEGELAEELLKVLQDVLH